MGFIISFILGIFNSFYSLNMVIFIFSCTLQNVHEYCTMSTDQCTVYNVHTYIRTEYTQCYKHYDFHAIYSVINLIIFEKVTLLL